TNQVEQVVDQLEQAHAIRVHRRQETARVRVRDAAALVQQRFEWREEQRERRAQLMADVCEEPALDLVEFLELAVALLQLQPVLIQFVTQGKFTKADAVVKPAPGDDENTGDE